MKSLITAILVFVFTLFICTASYFLATSFANDMLDDLSIIKKAIEKEDLQGAYDASARCLLRIEKNNYYMAAIANHGELGSMKNGLLKIHQHLKDKKTTSALLALVETEELFKHFLHSEKLTLENIF